MKCLPKGKPSIDHSAGTWVIKTSRKNEVPVPIDKMERLSGIRKLLQCETNSATDQDVRWWEQLFASIPEPGQPSAKELVSWNFRLPDVKRVRKESPPEAIDLNKLDDVEPESPPKHELIVTKTWTAGMKKKALRIEQEENELQKSVVQLQSGQYVFFLIDEDWNEMGQTQKNLPDAALKWGFLIGQVVKGDESKIATFEEVPEEAEISVIPWYPSKGDPNGIWIPWIRVGEDITARSSLWVVNIPRTSVVLVDPEFTGKTKKGRNRKKLTAETLKKLLSIPEIDFCYHNSTTGLIRKEEMTAILQARYDDLKRSRSEEGRAKESKALSVLTAHKRCLDYVKNHRARHVKAGCSITEVIPDSGECVEDDGVYAQPGEGHLPDEDDNTHSDKE
jgi:hypothetical protein